MVLFAGDFNSGTNIAAVVVELNNINNNAR